MRDIIGNAARLETRFSLPSSGKWLKKIWLTWSKGTSKLMASHLTLVCRIQEFLTSTDRCNSIIADEWEIEVLIDLANFHCTNFHWCNENLPPKWGFDSRRWLISLSKLKRNTVEDAIEYQIIDLLSAKSSPFNLHNFRVSVLNTLLRNQFKTNLRQSQP